MKLLLWLLAHVLALGVATWLLPGIGLGGGTDGRQLLTLIVVGAIFGVITSVVKPVVKLVSLPLIILTLGLLLLVINAVMLLLTAAIANALGFGFEVDGFGAAVVGGLVISLASLVIEALLPARR